MASGRDVHRHRRSDRLHRNVLLHHLENVVDSWTGCSAVPNKAREAREGWVGRHGVDGPAAASVAEALRTVEVAPVPLARLHWLLHSPIPGAESEATRLLVLVTHLHWSQHSPIQAAESAAVGQATKDAAAPSRKHPAVRAGGCRPVPRRSVAESGDVDSVDRGVALEAAIR